MTVNEIIVDKSKDLEYSDYKSGDQFNFKDLDGNFVPVETEKVGNDVKLTAEADVEYYAPWC